MDKEVHEKHSDTTFDDEFVEMYADIILQDILNKKVLFFIAKCEQSNMQVTVKTIAENVTSNRRVGVRNDSNTLVNFSNKEGLIDRKTAEKIVERLSYSSLIYFDVQLPRKFIKLTARGIQVAIKIRKQIGGN